MKIFRQRRKKTPAGSFNFEWSDDSRGNLRLLFCRVCCYASASASFVKGPVKETVLIGDNFPVVR